MENFHWLVILIFLFSPKTFAGGAFSREYNSAVGVDTDSSVYYPKNKIAFGPDGTATDVSASNPLPIALYAAGGGGGNSNGSAFSSIFNSPAAIDNISNVFFPKTKLVFGPDGTAINISTSNPIPVTCTNCSSMGILSINGLTSSAQSLVVGSNGNDFNIVDSVDTHTINLPTASASKRGLLSSSDWSLFNSKAYGLPVNKRLYVDINRSDSYTADGTIVKPFKTIMAAVNQVISNGDNSLFAYDIDVAPGVYPETVVLENAALYALSFHAHSLVTVGAFQSTASNTNLELLHVEDFFEIGPVTFTGDVNNTNFCANECIFKNLEVSGSVNATNVGTIAFDDANLQTDFNCTNVTSCVLSGGDGQLGGVSSFITDGAANAPNGFGVTNAVIEKTITQASSITVSAGTSWQVREGVRVGLNGTTMSCSGLCTFADSAVRADLTVNLGGTANFRGSHVDGAFVNNGTVNYLSTGLFKMIALTQQGSGLTPTCGTTQTGFVSLTHAFITCVCNGSSWVKTSDGSSACTF